ncbi:hypothetical protein IFM89_018897 [Coptis chinensis]|uniref:Transposase n=1 Tax=Coptis chinensis TaxID=261450 RepID=A0A835HCP7_9MAGN|nr:hypothetical protein IFM89_018897 [Coptis chinensis]
MKQGERKGKKRRKQENAAIHAALHINANCGIRISDSHSNQLLSEQSIDSMDRGSNTPTIVEPANTSTFAEPSKKRGRATCDTVATEKSKRMKVPFNERGQPIEDESNKLDSFLGATQKFVIKEEARNYVLKKSRCLWRTSKSRLNALIDAHDNKHDRIAACPKDMNRPMWKIFVRKHSSHEYQEKRKIFKQIRLKHTLPLTSNRLGYARVEAKMKKESSDPSSITRSNVWVKGHMKENVKPVNAEVAEKMKTIQEIKDTAAESSSSSLQDDAISQVFGTEHPGHVRGVGFGVTPSQMGILSESKEKVVQLERQVEKLSRKVSSIEPITEEMQDDIRQEIQEAIREEMHGVVREQMQQHILEKKRCKSKLSLCRI